MAIDKYVAPEYHTEEADRFLVQEAAKILASTTISLEVVSPERTSMIFKDAVAAGFGPTRARQLADHLDAGTEKINALPTEEAAEEYALQKQIIQEFLAASSDEQEQQIKNFEAIKAQLRHENAPTL